MKRKKRRKPEPPPRLRIIGGRLRGSLLAHPGGDGVRPMKDRVREAIFNLLGPAIQDKYALDLFAGSGALGLEAISRGARGATLIERHLPTARTITANVAGLKLEPLVQLVTGDTFLWVRQWQPDRLPTTPWVVFCSPPYDFFVDRCDDMLTLLDRLLEHAPTGTLFAVESDRRFDPERLPASADWDVRTYAPAVVAIAEKQDAGRVAD